MAAVENIPADDESTDDVELPEMEEIDLVKHYAIKTVISGYPITVNLDITPEGIVTGKYAYDSTLKKYGDKPSSWFALNGNLYDEMILMEASHPDYGIFEQWNVRIEGEGKTASIRGESINSNTNEVFFVGSNQKPIKYEGNENYGDVGDIYEEEAITTL